MVNSKKAKKKRGRPAKKVLLRKNIDLNKDGKKDTLYLYQIDKHLITGVAKMSKKLNKNVVFEGLDVNKDGKKDKIVVYSKARKKNSNWYSVTVVKGKKKSGGKKPGKKKATNKKTSKVAKRTEKKTQTKTTVKKNTRKEVGWYEDFTSKARSIIKIADEYKNPEAKKFVEAALAYAKTVAKKKTQEKLRISESGNTNTVFLDKIVGNNVVLHASYESPVFALDVTMKPGKLDKNDVDFIVDAARRVSERNDYVIVDELLRNIMKHKYKEVQLTYRVAKLDVGHGGTYVRIPDKKLYTKYRLEGTVLWSLNEMQKRKLARLLLNGFEISDNTYSKFITLEKEIRGKHVRIRVKRREFKKIIKNLSADVINAFFDAIAKHYEDTEDILYGIMLANAKNDKEARELSEVLKYVETDSDAKLVYSMLEKLGYDKKDAKKVITTLTKEQRHKLARMLWFGKLSDEECMLLIDAALQGQDAFAAFLKMI